MAECKIIEPKKLSYDIAKIPKRDELAERFMFPFSQLNFLLNGGLLDRVTLLASYTNSGKTTIVSQFVESVIEQGYNVSAAFMEDTAYESQDRIFAQSLKSNTGAMEYKPYFVNGKETNCGDWKLKDEFYEKAKNKFSSKLFLFNTKASTDIDSILSAFEYDRINNGCRIFVVDNCDQFDFIQENENKALKDIVIKIRDYAVNYKVHIFLVSHIRKVEREIIMPDLNDIKGTSALVNISKNVIIIVRTDIIDKESKQYKSLKQLLQLNGYNIEECDSILRVAKTKGKKLGYVGLKYNKITNTYYEPNIENRKAIENTTPKLAPPKQTNNLDLLLMIENDGDLPF